MSTTKTGWRRFCNRTMLGLSISLLAGMHASAKQSIVADRGILAEHGVFADHGVLADHGTQAPVLIAQQDVEDEKGNVFMEEVVDDKQAAKQRQLQEREQHPKLDRHPLTPEEASRLGIQITPQGQIIPLINRNGPPVKQYGTTFTSTFEPWWTFIPRTPWGTPLYANPFIGAPLMNRGNMNNVVPTPYGPGVAYGPGAAYGPGLAYGPGAPYAAGWNPFGPRLYSPYAPSYAIPYMTPFLNPFPYSTGWINTPPAVSYSYSTTPDAPNAPPPSSITTNSTTLTQPFWSGYMGTTPFGQNYGGVNLGLPTIRQIQSTTTFTPIAPHFTNGNTKLPPMPDDE